MAFDYAKYFGEIKLTHDLLSKSEERSWLLKPPRDGERHDVVLYLGCNVLRTSHMVQTVSAVQPLGTPGLEGTPSVVAALPRRAGPVQSQALQ